MKHWKETAEIFARARLLASAEKRAAIATVVRIEGSAYRRPGAKLLVEEDGSTAGGVSGGCLEADVREVGFTAFLIAEKIGPDTPWISRAAGAALIAWGAWTLAGTSL